MESVVEQEDEMFQRVATGQNDTIIQKLLVGVKMAQEQIVEMLQLSLFQSVYDLHGGFISRQQHKVLFLPLRRLLPFQLFRSPKGLKVGLALKRISQLIIVGLIICAVLIMIAMQVVHLLVAGPSVDHFDGF